MSGVLGIPRVLTVSQVSKSANSSSGESKGCVSPSPLLWVASIRGSQRRAALGIVPGHGLALDGLREHGAVADVAVVRDRQDAAAGLLLVCGHEGPEILGILAVERGEGQDLLHPVGPVPEHHDPVQIVAIDGRGPFVTVEHGESARIVVFGGRVDDPIPDRALDLGVVVLGFPAPEVGHHPDRDRPGGIAALLHGFVPLLALVGREQSGIGLAEEIGDPEVLGVVREHQEVQRADQLGTLAAVGTDLFTPCETDGSFQWERVPDQAAVDGQRRVEVGIAEEHPLREVLIDVGAVGLRLLSSSFRDEVGSPTSPWMTGPSSSSAKASPRPSAQSTGTNTNASFLIAVSFRRMAQARCTGTAATVTMRIARSGSPRLLM